MQELRKENQPPSNHKTEQKINNYDQDDFDEKTKQMCYSPPPIKLADKIDTFLEAVGKQQEALTKMLEQRRLGKTSVTSRISSSAVIANHQTGNGRKLRGGNTSGQSMNTRISRQRPQTAPIMTKSRSKPIHLQKQNSSLTHQ